MATAMSVSVSPNWQKGQWGRGESLTATFLVSLGHSPRHSPTLLSTLTTKKHIPK